MTVPSDDPIFRQLARLTPTAPDATHSAAVRARCHAALDRQRRLRVEGDSVRAPRRLVTLIGAGAFAIVYVLAVIHNATSMYGPLPPMP